MTHHRGMARTGRRIGPLLALLALSAACYWGSSEPHAPVMPGVPPDGAALAERFASFAEDFTRDSLALSPPIATLVGLHRHRDPLRGVEVDLDRELDDYSPEAFSDRMRYLRDSLETLDREFPARALPEAERTDRAILASQIRLGLLEMERIRSFATNPTVAVESIGTALFFPVVLEYDAAPARAADLVARLERLPAFVDQAIAAIETSAPIYTEVAIEENDGNRQVILGALPTLFPKGSRLEADYLRARGPALEALDRLDSFLRNDLAPRSSGDWRLGAERYGDKLRLSFQDPDLDPGEVLRDAEEAFGRVRRDMMTLALPLHAEAYADHGDHESMPDEEARISTVVLEVLDRIGREHMPKGDLFAAVGRDIERVARFLETHPIVSMTGRDNLSVIDTPPFLRGIYSVAGLNPAPPLQPALKSFYYVTPIPPDWPPEKIASKLREYNTFKLLLLTIHEAQPGHYTQLEYANRVEPEWRRVLRSVYGNNAYIEGWGQYAEEVMLERGIAPGPDGGVDPRMRLTFLKEELRVLANTILDVRLHTMEMSDQEALDLMMRGAFQERQEAEGKLRRAKLSSTQLPTYYLGWRDWRRLRRDVEAARGATFDLRAWHDEVLSQGAIPMAALRRLLLPGGKGGAR